MRKSPFLVLVQALAVVSVACSSDPSTDSTSGSPTPTSTTNGSPQPTPTAAPTATTPGVTPPGVTPPGVTPPKADDPGPAPAGCADLKVGSDGFFTRTTATASYSGFVPKSYAGKPTTLVVGIHGCGDTALHFAQWAVDTYATVDTQTHIGISVGGREGQCWDVANDAPKVTAAIADVKTCFYVHQKKVVLAGYSSGGILAYKMGLTDAGKYAGIIIENSGLEGTKPTSASWKINVAHIAHTSDGDFPIAQTKADWAALVAAGIPLQKSEVPGTHDGSGDDWSGFLIPKITTWIAP